MAGAVIDWEAVPAWVPAWVPVAVVVVLVAVMVYAVAVVTARYRVVWLRLNVARRAVTRWGARREAARLAAAGDEYRVWDAWRRRWVPDLERVNEGG